MKKNSVAGNESGGVLIMVAMLMTVLIGVAAFAIDIGHLMVVRNELRNAADAGALAGARVLYSSVTGTGINGFAITVNTGANSVAYAAATANASENFAVEVPAVERGHWCFNCTGSDGQRGVFTANPSLAPYVLSSLSPAAVDADTSYVNAVRVMTRRSSPASFFAGIFSGFSNAALNAESVAWLGFAGSHIHVDVPFGICIEQILDSSGNFNCEIGTMTSSNGIETLAWSNLTQPSDDGGITNTNASNLSSLVQCNSSAISDISINAGEPMSTNNGAIVSVFTAFYDCWRNNAALDTDGDAGHWPDQPWSVTVPLIQCGDGVNAASITPPNGSNMVLGAINIDLLWITPNGSENLNQEAPKIYTAPQFGCSCAASDTACHQQCWSNFLNHPDINVNNPDGSDLSLSTAVEAYHARRMYFKPNCELAATGGSGGAVSNVLAEIPRLVR